MVQTCNAHPQLGHVYADNLWEHVYTLAVMDGDCDLFSRDIGRQSSSVVGMVAGLIDGTDISQRAVCASGGIYLRCTYHDPKAIRIPTSSKASDRSRNGLLRING